MRLDVRVCGRLVARLYRERDAYVLKYLPDAAPTDFVSLTMPVREEAWRWPRNQPLRIIESLGIQRSAAIWSR